MSNQGNAGPKKFMLKFSFLVTYIVAIFGGRAFKEMIKLK